MDHKDRFLAYASQPYVPREGATPDVRTLAATEYTAHHIGEISRKLSELVEILKQRDQP